jgi:hypothetical protein
METPRPDFNKYLGVKTFNIVFFVMFANVWSSPYNSIVLPLLTVVILMLYTAYQQIHYTGTPIITSTVGYARIGIIVAIFIPLIY